MSYTSVEEAALFLNLDSTVLTDMETAQLTSLVSYVQGVIDNYCGYTISAKDYVNKRFDGSGTAIMDLDAFQVNTVTLVNEQMTDGTFTDWTDSIELLQDGTIQFQLSVGGTFTAGTQNIFITFNAGYVDTPADIAFAATYLVAINFNRISQYLIGIKSQDTASGMTTDYDSIELPQLVARTLDRYRKLSIY